MLYEAENLIIRNSDKMQISYDSFKFEKDVLTILKGKSGIGKTTLLKVLGLLAWDVSEKSVISLSIENIEKPLNLKDINWKDRQQFRKDHFAFIFQDDHLVDSISVRDNILFPSLLTHRDLEISIKRMDEFLTRPFLNSIEERLDDSCSTLSGGEKKKVALLRSILRDPQILLADEPWTNLDGTIEKGDVKGYVEFFIEQRQNKSTILATHHEEVINLYKDKEFVRAFELIDKGTEGYIKFLELDTID